ncbi:cytochrome P450 [Artomyces pyxidatus]|uniref:Cytochrome P450 n=1 Tax=Artomyces pyxidatus TaxID=48021 RepID=A0ACB8TE29_9AGAM|nr:cytochrome P450 [Artomyces pyxidatus]
MHPLLFSFGLLAIFDLARRVLAVRQITRGFGYFPGARMLISPISPLTRLLPRIPWILDGGGYTLNLHQHHDRYAGFLKYGWDGYTMVSAFPSPEGFIGLADAAAIKEVTTHRARFPKPVKLFKLMRAFGRNIVEAEGELWKRFRKSAAPAFSDRNNALVWDETVRTIQELGDTVWSNRSEITAENAVDITRAIALSVVGIAGFGRRISWTDEKVPQGHRMAFKDALHIVCADLILKAITPDWAMILTPRLRKLRLAFEEMKQYMSEMVVARRTADTKAERYDLLSSLIDEGDEPLSKSELDGNIFALLLAGHETIAHTTCFCLGFLALYPDEQERLYQQVKTVETALGRTPTYDDIHLLTYPLAVMYETLRLMPSAPVISKMSAEDTSLVVSNANGDKATLPVPKDTCILINIAALHYNTRYWDDPHDFKPARFLGDWPREAFMPFSQGPRGCIGRRFAETEGVAILTMLVSRYKIEVKDEPAFAAETPEERRARVLAFTTGVTMTPVRVPLTFKRR